MYKIRKEFARKHVITNYGAFNRTFKWVYLDYLKLIRETIIEQYDWSITFLSISYWDLQGERHDIIAHVLQGIIHLRTILYLDYEIIDVSIDSTYVFGRKLKSADWYYIG